MYLVAIAWLYVTLMMALAEATAANGSVLGAIVTFVLYGLLPLSIVLYILGTLGRKRARRQREAQEQQAHVQQQADAAAPASIGQPDQGGHPTGAAERGVVAPVREEP